MFLWRIEAILTKSSQLYESYDNFAPKCRFPVLNNEAILTSQSVFTCLKLTIETLEEGVKYVQSWE